MERKAHAVRVTRVSAKRVTEIIGQACMVAEDSNSRELTIALTAKRCRIVQDMTEADVFIAQDPTKVGRKVKFAAVCTYFIPHRGGANRGPHAWPALAGPTVAWSTVAWPAPAWPTKAFGAVAHLRAVCRCAAPRHAAPGLVSPAPAPRLVLTPCSAARLAPRPAPRGAPGAPRHAALRRAMPRRAEWSPRWQDWAGELAGNGMCACAPVCMFMYARSRERVSLARACVSFGVGVRAHVSLPLRIYTPSGRNPNFGRKPQSFRFRTYGRLLLRVSLGGISCSPESGGPANRTRGVTQEPRTGNASRTRAANFHWSGINPGGL
jgi:hypothetical protein